MKEYCQNISRLVFLGFVILISVYFMIINKRQSVHKIREHFFEENIANEDDLRKLYPDFFKLIDEHIANKKLEGEEKRKVITGNVYVVNALTLIALAFNKTYNDLEGDKYNKDIHMKLFDAKLSDYGLKDNEIGGLLNFDTLTDILSKETSTPKDVVARRLNVKEGFSDLYDSNSVKLSLASIIETIKQEYKWDSVHKAFKLEQFLPKKESKAKESTNTLTGSASSGGGIGKSNTGKNLPKPLAEVSIPKLYNPDAVIEIKDMTYNIQMIVDIFLVNFDRNPSKEELNYYLAYIETRKVTVKELAEIIVSNESKTYYFTDKSYKYYAKDQHLGTEDEVIATFNDLLDRNPDYAELRYYAKKLHEDKNFDIDRLKLLLISSDEYHRLQKTQTNYAFADTLQSVTDRQLSLIITKIYEEEVGEPIDDESLIFFKRQFKELQLDEDNLRSYIKKYASFEDDFEKSIGRGGNNISPAPAGNNVRLPTDPKEKEAIEKFTMGVSRENKPNKEILSQLQSVYNENNQGDYLNSSSVIDTLLNKKDTCPPRITDSTFSKKDKQMLANLVYDRNMDHMNSTCKRNKKYLDADEDMVLIPEFKWTVPMQRPPVCVAEATNQVQPLLMESSLVGTLLAPATAK